MLTKRQKISLLMEVRRKLMDYTPGFICIAIEQVMSEYEGRPYRAGQMPIEKYVPEMLKYKPEGIVYPDPWFKNEDTESRLRIIDYTIEDIEESIRLEGGERDFNHKQQS